MRSRLRYSLPKQVHDRLQAVRMLAPPCLEVDIKKVAAAPAAEVALPSLKVAAERMAEDEDVQFLFERRGKLCVHTPRIVTRDRVKGELFNHKRPVVVIEWAALGTGSVAMVQRKATGEVRVLVVTAKTSVGDYRADGRSWQLHKHSNDNKDGRLILGDGSPDLTVRFANEEHASEFEEVVVKAKKVVAAGVAPVWIGIYRLAKLQSPQPRRQCRQLEVSAQYFTAPMRMTCQQRGDDCTIAGCSLRSMRLQMGSTHVLRRLWRSSTLGQLQGWQLE